MDFPMDIMHLLHKEPFEEGPSKWDKQNEKYLKFLLQKSVTASRTFGQFRVHLNLSAPPPCQMGI
ncbi:hypothetical protein CK203_033411 [Vitis vinifera]|uniref:Uncharacterized protein n=1 Tax=Vitis vinifera TaxID=29760 RepID=A0A438HMN4_VITVI|nr:hypothetical protein CK203_033411 [Vitis vinifera]